MQNNHNKYAKEAAGVCLYELYLSRDDSTALAWVIRYGRFLAYSRKLLKLIG